MEPKTNYTLVGLTVIILLSSLLSMGLWLSVGFGQKSYKTYTVYIHEPVTGLSVEAPVKYNGVPVGFVKKIALNDEDPTEVRLSLSIEEDIPITTSTSATLISQGITGTAFLGLTASSSSLTPLKAPEGEPYPVIPAKPSLFKQLDTVFKDVAENINEVSVEIKRVFDAENAERFKKALANIEEITQVLAKNSKNLSKSIKNANEFLSQLAKVSHDFPEMMLDFKKGIRHFNRMTDTISATSQEVSETMVATKNSVNKFSQQTIPTTTQLVRKLNNIAANLEKVSNEMRQNPSVIIRGTPPTPPGPGE